MQHVFSEAPKQHGYKELLKEEVRNIRQKIGGVKPWQGEYEKLVQEAVETMDLDENTNRSLALRVYDLIQFEGLNYARLYTEKIQCIYAKDFPCGALSCYQIRN